MGMVYFVQPRIGDIGESNSYLIVKLILLGEGDSSGEIQKMTSKKMMFNSIRKMNVVTFLFMARVAKKFMAFVPVSHK
ncbi:MAG: hypothetical protein ABIL77_00975 [candidate division WOR-3 bacterium]